MKIKKISERFMKVLYKKNFPEHKRVNCRTYLYDIEKCDKIYTQKTGRGLCPSCERRLEEKILKIIRDGKRWLRENAFVNEFNESTKQKE